MGYTVYIIICTFMWHNLNSVYFSIKYRPSIAYDTHDMINQRSVFLHRIVKVLTCTSRGSGRVGW